MEKWRNIAAFAYKCNNNKSLQWLIAMSLSLDLTIKILLSSNAH